MAFGPLYADLPLAAATATRPATRYVDETSWNALIGSFSLWGDHVNANAKNLSNVGALTAAALHLGSSRASLDVNGPLAFTNIANLAADDFTSAFWTAAGGGVIGWNKAAGQGEFALVSISGGGSDGGFSFWDRNTKLARLYKSGKLALGASESAGAMASIWQGSDATNGLQISSAAATKFFYLSANDALNQARIGFWTGAASGQVRIYGSVALEELPAAYPGAGTKQLWYDPADGNRVKFAA